jgi:hypothetical protein
MKYFHIARGKLNRSTPVSGKTNWFGTGFQDLIGSQSGLPATSPQS